MGIFGKKKNEVRTADTGNLLQFISNENYVILNENNIMEIAGIKNSVDLISGTIASLPINLFKEKNGKIEKIENDERLFLLNNEPSSFVQANSLKRDLIKDMLLYGNAYALIDKKGLKVKGLYNIKSNFVTVTDLVNENGIITDKRYNFTLNNRTLEKNFFNILEVKFGKGILRENKEILSTLIYINAYENYVFKNAIIPSGVLETDGRLTKEGAESLKNQLENLYSGIRNWQKPMILEQGLKWRDINQKPQDLMLDKAKENAVKDIEKLFNLPYGFLNNVNNANVESQNLLFLQRTVTPLIIALEESLNQSLLLESEKRQNYYFRFDVSELMKLTNDKLVEFANKGLSGGIFTINEARKIMDLDPMENADKLVLSLGGVLFDKEGNTKVFNMEGGSGATEGSQDVSNDIKVLEDSKEDKPITKATEEV